eukprot:1161963-Pelagomonas_calceolata.AAC.11
MQSCRPGGGVGQQQLQHSMTCWQALHDLEGAVPTRIHCTPQPGIAAGSTIHPAPLQHARQALLIVAEQRTGDQGSGAKMEWGPRDTDSSKLRAAAHAGQVQKWLHLQTLSAAPAPPAAALSRLLLQKGVHVEAARMPQHERAR